MAQRLARKICPHCAHKKVLAEEEAKSLGLQTTTVYSGAGCEACNGTGYKGRIAVHEVIIVDKNMRKMIAETCSAEEISEYVERTQEFCTLREEMVSLVEQGITTVEELVRLTYGDS